MIVNGKEYNVDDLVKSLDLKSNSFRNIGNFLLTEREIGILERNFIDYRTSSSLKDLMMKIQAILEDEEIDVDDALDLDYVLEQISERDYYENTNK